MLTKKQKQIFDYIVEFHVKNNRPASIREVAAHFGLNHTGIYKQILSIEKKGFMQERSIAKGIITKYEGEEQW